MAGINVSFDSNSLQTSNIIVSDIIHDHIPTKDAKLFAKAHANQSHIPFVSYPNKYITVKGVVSDTTVALLDARLDSFRNYFINPNSNLDIDYNGTTRRYTATVNSVVTTRPGNLAYSDFEITFIATNPFGQDVSSTTILNVSAATISPRADNYTFLGTAPYQRPIVTITPTAFTGAALATISFGNQNSGQQTMVTRTWTAGDILTIDAVAKKVALNGIEVAFDGAIAEFATGAQTLTYSDTFTTRSFNYTVAYNVLYL